MPRTRLTSKGQVTVPIDVRRALDLHAGDELVFEVQGDEIRVRAEKRRQIVDLRGALRATRPFQGRDAVRVETARRLAEDLQSGSREDRNTVTESQ
ncbi:MAG: AbrB/MazE/SpoVT family DNA-binding domain-containing protein [Thermoleophilia bacterium]